MLKGELMKKKQTQTNKQKNESSFSLKSRWQNQN